MSSRDGSPKKGKRLLRIRKKERTRNNILTEAAKLFSEKTYDEVLLEEIAEAAFISRQTLYNYFNNKEDVFFAVGNQIYIEENEKMAQILSSDRTGKEQIIHLLEKKFRDSHENPILLKIIREFWERFSNKKLSSAEVVAEIAQKIGADQLDRLVDGVDSLEDFDVEEYFDEPSFIELVIQFLKNGNLWVKAIQKGKQDHSIRNTLPDMEIMHFLNIVSDGVIHETMRRRTALERVNMKQETFVTNTINLLSIFLDGEVAR